MALPPPWRIRCYSPQPNVDEFKVWYDDQSVSVQRKFLSRLEYLRLVPIQDWRFPLFRWLHGDAVGLGEIRFFVDRVQQRPLGFRSGENEFTLLFAAQEKSDRFIPRNAVETALRRKAEIENDGSRSIRCWLFDS